MKPELLVTSLEEKKYKQIVYKKLTPIVHFGDGYYLLPVYTGQLLDRTRDLTSETFFIRKEPTLQIAAPPPGGLRGFDMVLDLCCDKYINGVSPLLYGGEKPPPRVIHAFFQYLQQVLHRYLPDGFREAFFTGAPEGRLWEPTTTWKT